jgi:AraC-like DNA-binding protein
MGVVRGLLHTVEQSGVSQLRLLRAANLDPLQLDSAEARLPRWVVYRLCELAMELTGDPALGLHWGERLDTSAFPPISHLISHTATLRQAFEALARFQPLLSDQLGFELIERDGKVIVQCHNMPDESLPTQRFVAEMIVIGMFRLVRFFNPLAQLDRVSFAYAAPSYQGDYARVFERAARFDQPFTGIVFDSALMNTASPYKDADLHDALRSIVERRVLRLIERAPYAQRVSDFLVQQSSPQQCAMATVASALGLSVRSLRRRLADEDKAYGTVVNEACAIVAKRLLVERPTIQEAAFEMGFAGTTAFYRAFKRWTGTTPSAFRKQALDAGPHG